MYHLDADITLIDKRNHHLFQPLLYQVATGGLSPANVAAPLRSILRRQKNTRVMMNEVVDFDVANQAVILRDRSRVPYDTLLLAAGSHYFYFGHDDWATLAPGLKSVEDATCIRRRILSAFEEAEQTEDLEQRVRLLTFVVVGGGPTGVEMANAIAELAHHTLRNDFRVIDPTTARILLVEGMPQVLQSFPEKLAQRAVRSLRHLNVEVWTNALVTNVQTDHVIIKHDNQHDRVNTETVVWAAGVKASPLGTKLAEVTGAETDKSGRVFVNVDLSLPKYPEIFVIGDLAYATYLDGKTLLPDVAPVAMQQGRYVA